MVNCVYFFIVSSKIWEYLTFKFFYSTVCNSSAILLLKRNMFYCLSSARPIVHIFHVLFLPAPTFYIHIFNACIQLGTNILVSLPSLLFSPSICIHAVPPSHSFSNSTRCIHHTVRVSPKSCQDMFCCQQDAEWSALDFGLSVSLTRNKPIKGSPSTA